MAIQGQSANVRSGLIAAAVAGLIYTLDLPLLRLAGLDQWTLVFGRGVLLFAAIFAGWLFWPASGRERPAFIAGWAGIWAAAANTLSPICYIAAVTHTTAANVVFIMALIPLLSALASRLFMNEQVHIYTWAATGAALLGVGIIVGGSMGSGTLYGDAMAFVTALCMATAIFIARSCDKPLVTSFATGSLVSALLAVTVFGAAPATMSNVAGFGAPAWVWLGLNGLVLIPLALILISQSPRLIPSTDVSMFFLLETVLTPLWVWGLTGEVPSSRSILGGMIIVLTLLLHSAWRLRMTMATAPAVE